MDGDFQSNYLAAEQAYGAGDFETAQSITVELLNQLEPIPEEGAERDAVLAWRAFVALLAGHIDLYGFQAPDQAERHYQLVLASHPQDTLRELAEQGLERIRSGRESVTRSTQATEPAEDRFKESLAIKGSLALVADPFINAASPAVDSVEPSVVTTAMPWLNNDEQSDDGHDQTLSIEINAVTEPEPETEPQPISEQEPEPGSEPEPGGELGQETTTQAVTPAPKTKADPEISDTIRKRLREGRIVVELPATALPPSEDNSDSSQAPSRWSWLQKALRRS